jgi:glycolate oxidase FAD binding subunit
MLDALRGILGAERALAIERDDPRYAPHRGPLVHALPRDRGEAAEVLTAATRDRFPVVIVGGNSAPRVGPADEGPICLLSTELLDRVVAFDPGDQTLVVEAGASVDSVLKLCAPKGLFAALHATSRDRSTIGGVVAAGVEGPLAARHGRIRDQLLGVVFATGDGKIATSGGRVVKNVTGYDLSRLHVGARGAYGVLLEIVVRLRPIPEAATRLVFRCADEAEAYERALDLRDASVDAANVDVLFGAASETYGGGPTLVATLEGGPATRRAAKTAVERVLKRGVDATEAVDFEADRRPEAPRDLAVLRLHLAPPLWRAARGEAAAGFAAPIGGVFDALLGVRETWHDPASRLWESDGVVEGWLAARSGALDLPRDPTFHRLAATRLRKLVPNGAAWMRRLKTTFDPAGILNPGRSVFDASEGAAKKTPP